MRNPRQIRDSSGRPVTRGGAAAGLTDILVLVRSVLPNLAPAERRIAERVVAEPGQVAAETITELARSCQTSETTVVRFCRTIGLRGYPELRLALATAAGQAQRANGFVPGDISVGDDLATVVKKIGYSDARAVEETAAALDVEVLAAVATAVANARRTDLYGVGASGFVALDLQQKLQRIGIPAFAWTDPHMALTSAALLEPGDVAIAMSHTGTTVDTIDSLGLARRNGATAVALTNFPRSPLAATADLVLTTAARETRFRSGATASRIAQLTVVDCLFVALAQRDYPATQRALARTYAAVVGRRVQARRPRAPGATH